MILLIGADGDVTPIMSDKIGHIDSGKLIGECTLYTSYNLAIRLKGTRKEVALEINRQLQDFYEIDMNKIGDLRGQ